MGIAGLIFFKLSSSPSVPLPKMASEAERNDGDDSLNHLSRPITIDRVEEGTVQRDSQFLRSLKKGPAIKTLQRAVQEIEEFLGQGEFDEEGFAIIPPSVQARVIAALIPLGVNEKNIKITERLRVSAEQPYKVTRYEVSVNNAQPIQTFVLAVTQAVTASKAEVVRSEISNDEKKVDVVVSYQQSPLLEISLIQDSRFKYAGVKMAVIIDDFGLHSEELSKRFLNLPFPITAAIIPGKSEVKFLADYAIQQGKDILIHLPMEPKNYPFQDPGPGVILVHHSKKEIETNLQRALKSIPKAVGFNNHMGSRATEDPEVMHHVLKTIKELDKFFIDSQTTPHSVVLAVAKTLNCPTNVSAGFIDDVDEVRQIEAKLVQYAAMAKKNGSVIFIGHIRKRTLETLTRMIPQLQAEGMQIVSVSSLVKYF